MLSLRSNDLTGNFSYLKTSIHVYETNRNVSDKEFLSAENKKPEWDCLLSFVCGWDVVNVLWSS